MDMQNVPEGPGTIFLAIVSMEQVGHGCPAQWPMVIPGSKPGVLGTVGILSKVECGGGATDG